MKICDKRNGQLVRKGNINSYSLTPTASRAVGQLGCFFACFDFPLMRITYNHHYYVISQRNHQPTGPFQFQMQKKRSLSLSYLTLAFVQRKRHKKINARKFHSETRKATKNDTDQKGGEIVNAILFVIVRSAQREQFFVSLVAFKSVTI